jgi:stage IV sporulation protein FB
MGYVMLLRGLGVQFVAYLLVVLVHEFFHAEVAQKLGYQMNEIRLNVYGASLSGEFNAVRRRDEILIALAGPFINLVFAIFIAAVWWFFPATYLYSESLLAANLTIFSLNILPIYPLDGGRILLSILSGKFKRQKAYNIFKTIGLVVSFLLLILSGVAIFYGANITIGIIAAFVFLASLLPDKTNQYQRLYSIAYRSQKIKRGLPVKEIVVASDTSLGTAFRMLNSSYFYRFVVVNNGKIVKTIYENDLEKLAVKKGYNSTFGTEKL